MSAHSVRGFLNPTWPPKMDHQGQVRTHIAFSAVQDEFLPSDPAFCVSFLFHFCTPVAATLPERSETCKNKSQQIFSVQPLISQPHSPIDVVFLKNSQGLRLMLSNVPMQSLPSWEGCFFKQGSHLITTPSPDKLPSPFLLPSPLHLPLKKLILPPVCLYWLARSWRCGSHQGGCVPRRGRPSSHLSRRPLLWRFHGGQPACARSGAVCVRNRPDRGLQPHTHAVRLPERGAYTLAGAGCVCTHVPIHVSMHFFCRKGRQWGRSYWVEG